jgi:SAM-dependent methyltransferase
MNLDVYQGELNTELSKNLGSFNVIVLLDVIEHLVDPRKVLTIANSILCPKGVIILTTGNWHSILARITGKHWRLMTPPQHLFFFHIKALHRILSETGFEIKSIEYPWKIVPVRLIIFQILNRLGLRTNFINKINSFGIPVNLFDAVRIIGEKK